MVSTRYILLDRYIFQRIVCASFRLFIEAPEKLTRMRLTKRSLGIARNTRVSGKSIACRYHALEVQFLTARGFEL
ncbi:MAG: hypothetical protein A2580_16510 [Hydrogenophilales bacterium RIFOXYD1_FULL_62_11]|nr:MAG: hypothetical protein A2580_16510 [Hydrogenophilales bacterium RIFOXYD1_FULL_62_11]